MKMKQVMSHNINNGLLNIIRRTDPMIIIVSFLYLFMQRTYADSYGLSVKIRCRPLLIIVTGYQARCEVLDKNPHHFLASGGDSFFLPFLVLYVKRRAGFSDSKQVAVSEDAALFP